MLLNKHGKFQNQCKGSVVTSHYSGSFDEIGIRAIFTDVLAKSTGMEHWVWEQVPDQQTGITETGIAEMISRYRTLHIHGCRGIGVNYTNPLIKHVKLPHDGSIVVPFKVSKESQVLQIFFDKVLAEAIDCSPGKMQQKLT